MIYTSLDVEIGLICSKTRALKFFSLSDIVMLTLLVTLSLALGMVTYLLDVHVFDAEFYVV